MPVKARYWKNPEYHRAEYRNRLRRLYVLGVRHVDTLSPAARAKRAAYKAKWEREHPESCQKARKKYRAKLRRLFGTAQPRHVWLYTLKRETENAKRRKTEAANPPPRPNACPGRRIGGILAHLSKRDPLRAVLLERAGLRSPSSAD